MSATCRAFYTAMRSTSQLRVLERFAGAAVLGDALGYTVELRDGEQIEVGRQCCKFCARTEALSKLTARMES
jgi:hypothetical protein